MECFHAYHKADEFGEFKGTDFYTNFKTSVGDLLYVVIGTKPKGANRAEYSIDGCFKITGVEHNRTGGSHGEKKWHITLRPIKKAYRPITFSSLAEFDREKYNNKIISTGGFKKITENTREFVGLFETILDDDAASRKDKEQALDKKSAHLAQSLRRESTLITIQDEDQKKLEADTISLKTDEREAVVKVRFGQGDFRAELLKRGEKCWMSDVEGKKLLVASHIKPWSHCEKDPESRGNPDNGLLLSSLWDAAFDAGLITFDEQWIVIASSELSASARHALNIETHNSLPILFRNSRRAQYIAYHRMVIFEGWKNPRINPTLGI